MVISLSFEELHAYVDSHYQKDLAFSKVSDKEFRVTFIQKMFIKDVHIGMDIHIDEVTSDSVTLTYKGGMALDMIISGAIKLLENKLAEFGDGVKFGDDNRVTVNLAKIEKTKAVVDKIALRDLIVEDTALNLIVALK
ncbi:MAG: hypothetical protein K2H57_10700 [Duncaniella sp.]|nr:hypothetical protein [Duncaniella sp.]